MKLPQSFAVLGAIASVLGPATAYPFGDLFKRTSGHGKGHKIAPKFVIISMFSPEAAIWYGIPEFDVLANNYTLPGLSLEFPDLHCTKDNEICQVTTSMAGRCILRNCRSKADPE